MDSLQNETPGPRAVTFDVGFTLLHPYPSAGELYVTAARRHGLDLPPTEAEPRFQRSWQQVKEKQSGLIYGTDDPSALGMWRQVVAGMFTPPPADRLLDRLVQDLYDTFSSAAAWRLDPTWLTVAAGLRRRGFRLGLISNWDVRLRGLLSQLELEGHFDSIVISAEHAIEKPDPAIFHRALCELGITDPAGSYHIGDTWNEDVTGAALAGMCPVWFNPLGTPRPATPLPRQCELRSLEGLLALA